MPKLQGTTPLAYGGVNPVSSLLVKGRQMQTLKLSISIKDFLPRRPVRSLLYLGEILNQGPTMVLPERKFLNFRMPRLLGNTCASLSMRIFFSMFDANDLH